MAKGIARGLATSDGQVFKTVPSGVYNARIMQIEDTKTGPNSKHPGNPMVKIMFRIVSDEETVDGRQLFSQIVLPYGEGMNEVDSQRQIDAIAAMYIALGLERDESDEYDTDDWMGQECQIVVTEKEYPEGSGKMVNNVSDVLPVD